MRNLAVYLFLGLATLFGAGFALADFVGSELGVLCALGSAACIVAALLIQPMAHEIEG